MYLGTISKEVESYFVFRSVNLLLIADSLSHPFFRYLLYSSVVITSPKYSAIIVFFIRPSLKKDANYILGKADSYKPERNVKQYVLD